VRTRGLTRKALISKDLGSQLPISRFGQLGPWEVDDEVLGGLEVTAIEGERVVELRGAAGTPLSRWPT